MHEPSREREQTRHQLRALAHVQERAEGCCEYREGGRSDLGEGEEVQAACWCSERVSEG